MRKIKSRYRPLLMNVVIFFFSVPISEFYSRNFKHFLKDFEIEFVKEACIENGIDAVETFLMLEKDDLRYVIGMNLGQAFYCIKAQKKFLELER